MYQLAPRSRLRWIAWTAIIWSAVIPWAPVQAATGGCESLFVKRDSGFVARTELFDVNQFDKVENLGQGMDVLVLVKKSLPQDAVNLKKPALGPRRSRPPEGVPGLVLRMRLESMFPLRGVSWIRESNSPMGFASNGVWAVYASLNRIEVVDAKTGAKIKTIDNLRWGGIHTLEFSKRDPNRLLIVVSGTETVLELDLLTEEIVWSWDAYDHGYRHSRGGMEIILHGEASDLADNQVLLDRERPVPTASGWGREMMVAFPNWASYADPDEQGVYASLYWTGQIIRIDRDSGTVTVVREGLKRPHGYDGTLLGRMVSNSMRGTVEFTDRRGESILAYDFSRLPFENDPGLDPGHEWIQNTRYLGQGLYATVDGRRMAVYVWNPTTRQYSRYRTDPTWEIQSVEAVDDRIQF